MFPFGKTQLLLIFIQFLKTYADEEEVDGAEPRNWGLAPNFRRAKAYYFGGLKFGHNGKVYSVSSQACKGGLFFKKPIEIEFLCLDGYFLLRSDCSSKDEKIVGGKNYVCSEYQPNERPKVKAIISLTEGEMPNEHSITFYDNTNTLKNFRKYSLAWALRGIYNASSETGAPNMIVVNTHKTPEYQIGNICYAGKHKTFGAAFQLKVEGSFTAKSGNASLVDKPCRPGSIKVDLESGKSFPVLTGKPPLYSQRFAGEIWANTTLDFDGSHEVGEDRSSAEESDKLKSTEIDNPTISPEGTTPQGEEFFDTTRSEVYMDFMSSTEQPGSGGENGGSGGENGGPGGENGGPGGENGGSGGENGGSGGENGGSGGENGGSEGENGGPGGENENGNTEKDTYIDFMTTENSNGGEGGTSGEGGGGTGDPGHAGGWGMGDKGEPVVQQLEFHYPVNLKAKVELSPRIKYLDPFFEEDIVLAIYSMESIGTASNSSNARAASENLLETPETWWYTILKESVEIVKKLVPNSLVPDDFFTDAFKIFSFMFRNIEDNMNLMKEGDFNTIIQYLKKCGDNSVEPSINTTGCPFMFDFYNSENGSQLRFDNEPPTENRFNSEASDLVVESIWNVVDVIYMKCLPEFREDLGKHTRMIVYLTETIFLNDRVQARWFRKPEPISVYESILPYGNLEILMFNYEKLRATFHYGDVIEEWLQKPRRVIPYNTHREDEWQNERRKSEGYGNPESVGTNQKRPIVNVFQQSNSIQETEDWSRKRKRRDADEYDDPDPNAPEERVGESQEKIISPWVNPKRLKIEEATITNWDGLDAYCVQLLATPLKGYKQGTRISQWGGLTPSLNDFATHSMC